MIIYTKFNSVEMHRQGLAERTRPAHQHAVALAQGAIQRLHGAGLPAALGAGPVRGGGQDVGVRFPSVGVVHGVVLVTSGQGFKKSPPRGGSPAPSPRCAARHAPPLARAKPCACACRRRSIFRPAPVQPVKTRLGPQQVQGKVFTLLLFLFTWRPSCGQHPSPGRCCVGSCARPPSAGPAPFGRFWTGRPAPERLGACSRSSGTWLCCCSTRFSAAECPP